MPKVIVSADHPLSIGYSVLLCSQNTLFTWDSEVSQLPDSVIEAISECKTANEIDIDGYCHVDHLSATITIFIGRDLSVIRTLEVLVHEVSHAVEHIFRLSAVKPCSELRAYYNDWIFGKCLHHTLLVSFSDGDEIASIVPPSNFEAVSNVSGMIIEASASSPQRISADEQIKYIKEVEHVGSN